MKKMQNIIVALLLIVIFGLAFVAVWHSPKQPAQTHGGAKYSDINCNKNEKESVWVPSTYEPITTFTAALVVVTVIQAGLFFVQLSFMRDGIKDAKDAAQAAMQGNRISRENFIARRRAWLSIEKVALKQKTIIAESGATFFMEIIVRNVGDTPATSAMVNVKTSPNGGRTRNANVHIHQCKEEARAFPPPMGVTIFPGRTRFYKYTWAIQADLDESLTMLPYGGNAYTSVFFPIAVSYRILGDAARHITYHGYDLTMPLPVAISETDELVLEPGPIGVDEID